MRNKLCFYMAPLPSIKSYYDMLDMSAEYGFDKIEGFCMLDFSEPDIEAAKKINQNRGRGRSEGIEGLLSRVLLRKGADIRALSQQNP